MNTNIHGYKYKVGDQAWILTDQLEYRSGVCKSYDGIVSGKNTYTFIMNDTQAEETFSHDELFPLLSHAEIKRSFLVTPTPSISRSVTPTPTRTPHPSPTPSITPSTSYTFKPNLLKNSIWTSTGGTTTTLSETDVKFTANSGNKFTTTVNVNKNEIYSIYIGLSQLSCRNLNIKIESNNDATIFESTTNVTHKLLDRKYNDSSSFEAALYTNNATEITITLELFSDANNNSWINGLSYRLVDMDMRLTTSSSIQTPNLNAYDSVVMSKNPLAYWPFNTDMDDMVNKNRLTPFISYKSNPTDDNIPDVALTPDSFGNLLTISSSGSGTLMDTPYNLQENYSLEAWINYSDSASGAIIGTVNPDFKPNGLIKFTNTFELIPPTRVEYGTFMADGKKAIKSPSGKIYIINSDNAIRLNSDGTTDNTFSTLNTNSTESLIEDENGKIYVANNTGIIRLNNDGSLDSSFTHISPPGGFGTIKTVTITSDKMIYCGGAFTGHVMRLHPDGTSDNSYTIDLGAPNGSISSIYQTSDGKIYVGGSITTSSYTTYDLLFRLNSDGSVDDSFTRLNLNYTSSPVVDHIVQAADGKIYIAGRFETQGTVYSSLARLNSDGTLDTTFVDLGLTNSNYARGIYVGDNNIYIYGSFKNIGVKNYNLLIRLTNDGSLDETLNPLGVLNGDDSIYDYFELNGTIYLVGHFQTPTAGLSVSWDDLTIDYYGNLSANNLSITSGTTYHIVATVDDSSAVTYYVNGVAYTTDNIINYNLYIGAIGADSKQDTFIGTIGNVAIYNTALTQEQVLENYNTGINDYRYTTNS